MGNSVRLLSCFNPISGIRSVFKLFESRGCVQNFRKFGQPGGIRGDTPRAPQSVLKSWTDPKSRLPLDKQENV